MRSGLESPLVCFHNVVLRAIVSTDLIAIAVIVSISVPVLARGVFAGGTNEIEGSDATTIALTEIDIEVNRAAKEVGSVNLGRVHTGRLHQHSSRVSRDDNGFVMRLERVKADVKCFRDTILSDLDLGVAVGGLEGQYGSCEKSGSESLHQFPLLLLTSIWS